MKNIFISYRRSDSYDTAHRLEIELSREFGEENVFFDQTSAPPGTAWPHAIRVAAKKADALLVVIGPKWLHTQDEKSGRRRLDIKDDWVRLEILTFLKRKKATRSNDLLILPLLVNGATMPRSEYVDNELGPLCAYQPMEVPSRGSELDFVQVKQRLIECRFQPIVRPAVVDTPMSPQIPLQLTQKQEKVFRSEYKQWDIRKDDKGVPGDVMRQLHRVYEFTSYEMAWRFMVRVDELGIRPYNHHPRWQNAFNRVEVWLCTNNIGHKPSKKDIRLAKIFESVWEEFRAEMLQSSRLRGSHHRKSVTRRPDEKSKQVIRATAGPRTKKRRVKR
jgi:4a-hydroxytetrahydrobiopterin dehydratase